HHQAGTEVSTAALETLAQSVIQGDFAQVQRLATSQLVSKPDAANRTVLMLVADAPETPIQAEKCVMYLFELGANQKSIIDDSGDTAAHLAARRDHLRLLMLLSFDAKWLQNRRGATPLMEAARTGSWRCAKHLLHLLRQRQFYKPQAGKPSNSVRERLLGLKDVEGRTAFDLARINGHSELANYIKREMRLTELAEQGELEKLIRAGDWTRLRQKVTRANCDLPDSSGFTALIRAAQSSNCNDEALWEVLVQLGDPTCAETLSRTCLHWSASSGNSVAASILLAAGASANAREDRSKSTPLMQAALYAPKDTAVQVSQILMDAGSDWSLKDSCSKTALDLIRSDGNPDLVELLQKYKGKKFYEEPLKPPHEDPPFMERWDVGDLIGRGGSGEVYKVLTDKGIECVAKIIKLPVGQLTADQYAQDRTKIDKAVKSERNLCRLQHRNIVRFLHIAQTEPATIVLFMELLEGKTLETFINGAPMPENKIRDFSEQICSALLYMHSRRPPVIHRDINCSNIMVLSEGTRIKLIDFGLSIELKL
uniref:Protein kinase domain-containing protein n=1 Tax=Macrostomum lignano TaxID=282301 RepID=A0A1I8HR55_9PLAT